MSLPSAETVKGSARAEGQRARGRLFRKYVVLLVSLVAGVLTISGGLSIYFSYEHEKAALAQIQQEKAVAAAAVIRQFIEEIQTQIGWTTQLSLLPDAAGVEQRRIDYYRLLRQAPAITEIAFVDGSGKEQLRVSRLAMDVASSQADLSDEPAFRSAREAGACFGPVYFRKESEPYMTLAARGSGQKGDVTIAEVNLKFIRDVISEIRVGKEGYAYVVDAEGRLVAHPDLAMVLRKTDLSTLPQVRDVTAAPASPEAAAGQTAVAAGLDGREALSAHAAIAPLNWHVLVETPLSEAFAPLYTTLLWNAGLLVLGLAIAVLASLFLARNLVGPVRALQDGAARIGRGNLGSRIDIRTGDELQSLAEHFNQMAGQLQESYANLEHKVEERTHELASARQRLVDAIESISEGFAFYDADDRLQLCNTRYRELLYAGSDVGIEPDTPFETIVRRAVERGQILEAAHDPEAYVRRRLAQHRDPGPPTLQHRADGRWILIAERKVAGGGTVAIYADITELKQREMELEEDRRGVYMIDREPLQGAPKRRPRAQWKSRVNCELVHAGRPRSSDILRTEPYGEFRLRATSSGAPAPSPPGPTASQTSRYQAGGPGGAWVRVVDQLASARRLGYHGTTIGVLKVCHDDRYLRSSLTTRNGEVAGPICAGIRGTLCNCFITSAKNYVKKSPFCTWNYYFFESKNASNGPFTSYYFIPCRKIVWGSSKECNSSRKWWITE
jgi:HAMP domain-containing protein